MSGKHDQVDEKGKLSSGNVYCQLMMIDGYIGHCYY